MTEVAHVRLKLNFVSEHCEIKREVLCRLIHLFQNKMSEFVLIIFVKWLLCIFLPNDPIVRTFQ